jgi:hypothetical protein
MEDQQTQIHAENTAKAQCKCHGCHTQGQSVKYFPSCRSSGRTYVLPSSRVARAIIEVIIITITTAYFSENPPKVVYLEHIFTFYSQNPHFLSLLHKEAK